MNPTKTITALTISAVTVIGTVDASMLNETPVSFEETVAGEIIKVEQVENIVEVELPWKEQSGITVKYDMGDPTLEEQIKDQRNTEVVTQKVGFRDGGFKIDLLLNEKPNTNVFCWYLDGWTNYDFEYQPPLNEIIKPGKGEQVTETSHFDADGELVMYRPPEIVGSYAVYHKSFSGNGFQTGKYLHILRPEVWEVDSPTSTRQYATLSFADGNLCVTTDPKFIETATYPVQIDPTFGYTTAGATNVLLCRTLSDSTSRRGNADTLTEDGTVDSLHVYLRAGAAGQTVDLAMFLNTEDAVANSHPQVVEVERTSVSVSTSATWYTFTAASESVVADDYVISALCDGLDLTSNNIWYFEDSTGSTRNLYVETIAGGYTTLRDDDPWTVAETTGTIRRSMYVTYTATPPSTGTPIFRPQELF